MQGFTVRFQPDGWHISDGRVDFGPYSSQQTAAQSATDISRQMALRLRNGNSGGETPRSGS